MNLYAYCRNNPIVYYDPSGNECVGNANAKENVQKENVTDPKNNETLKYRNWDGEIPRSGDEWYGYLNNKYGKGNVAWKPVSFDDILQNPEKLYGSTQKEIANILGNEWSAGNYGKTGTGWKFVLDDKMVFYHLEGVHEGEYYGFSTAFTGKVKIVGKGYLPTQNDKATVIYFYEGD